MLSPESLAKAREQFGIHPLGMSGENMLNNRANEFSNAVGIQTTTPAVPENPVPQHSIFDTLMQGLTAAKKRASEAAMNLPDPRTPEGEKELSTLVGGFAGTSAPVATKGAQLLDKVLTEHITSAKQILDNLPKENLEKGGGMKELLDRTKINIADALKAYKLPDAEKEVRGLDLSKYTSLDDFAKDVEGKLHAHLQNHVDTAAEVQAKPAFGGFEDLSTKLLEQLKGRTSVSKQFIEEATNQAGLKQPERDLIRGILKDEGDNVDVPTFANKVKSELLPLEARPMQHGRYESVSLPDELRGPVANYEERIYNSPIKTSAGDIHYGGSTEGKKYEADNYFAHTRIEDLPEDLNPDTRSPFANNAGEGSTRRVIEIQSDLFQKGRLEEEFPFKNFDEALAEAKSRGGTEAPQGKTQEQWDKEAHDLANKWMKEQEEAKKLEPYRNTWHERVIREEVKQAAKDGKTKLQFPTGETAMKIEGLGSEEGWTINNQTPASPADLKVGTEIFPTAGNMGAVDEEGWIITDVLGDGKFKAVQKRDWEKYGNPDNLKTAHQKAQRQSNLNAAAETFDISGSVDKENPIYRFYNKEVRKYLQNKYGAKEIVDPQGVSWVQVDIKPEMSRVPIEAFGAGLVPLSLGQENQQE